ncbi:MAG: hypothetical protein IJD95_05045 [Clostridia bacterium]|nr:hypothetical protein [Clostridia bacterium]
MKFKKFIAALAAFVMILPLFSFMASADTKADKVVYDFPAESLAELEIDFDNPIATSGNLKMYFVRFAGLAKETLTTADEVIVDRLIGIKNAVFVEEVDQIRPSGLRVGALVVAESGILSDLQKASFKEGTLITEIDGAPITSVADYVAAMEAKKLGDKIKISYVQVKEDNNLTANETLTDKAPDATKNIFMLEYMKEHLKDTELGVAIGDLVIPEGMTETEFKKLIKVEPGAIMIGADYTVEIKKATGSEIIDPATGKAPESKKSIVNNFAINTKQDFLDLYEQFLEDYEYYKSLRKEKNTVTVKFTFKYVYYQELNANVTAGVQTDALFVLDSQNAEAPYLWRSSVDETEYQLDTDAVIDRWKGMMRSLVLLYADQLRSESATGTKTTYASGDSDRCKTSYTVKNGKLVYSMDFTDAKISFDIELGLTDGTFYAKVLNDTIKEYGEGETAKKVIDIELLPFFGAVNSVRNGYSVVPDGSGMMINFAENVNSIYAKEYAFSVGGSDILDMDKYLKNQNLLEDTNLPVFGMANLDKKVAFVAYSATADAEASVITSPAGYAVDLYRSSLRFRYRYVTDILATNITAVGNSIDRTQQNLNIKRIAGKKYTVDKACAQDHEVRYSFLSGDAANYSGMANAYRDYLVKTGNLVDNIANTDDLPIMIDYFMATWESQILFTKIVKMTSFADAKEITEELYNNGVTNIYANFVGYVKGGYGKNPRIWPIEGAVGGAGGAKSFAAFADAKNIKTFLSVEPIMASLENGGFSTKNEIVNFGNSVAVSDKKGDKYFLNAPAVVKKLNAFAKNIDSIGFSGVALETMGNLLLQNYKGSTLTETRTDTMNRWDGILKTMAEKTDMLAVEGSSLYTLKYSNHIIEMPSKSSEYHITYKSIPFVQLIIHGYVTYTDEPINLFYDQDVQRLKLVEYGCIPYYKITKEPTENLKLSNYTDLFSSEYAQWKDDIIAFYALCNEKLADVWDQPMVYHENNGTTAIVRYANGKTLVINYTDAALEIEGVTVGAYDFEVK